MHDALYCERRFGTPNVIGEANQECLAIEVGTSIPSVILIGVPRIRSGSRSRGRGRMRQDCLSGAGVLPDGARDIRGRWVAGAGTGAGTGQYEGNCLVASCFYLTQVGFRRCH